MLKEVEFEDEKEEPFDRTTAKGFWYSDKPMAARTIFDKSLVEINKHEREITGNQYKIIYFHFIIHFEFNKS